MALFVGKDFPANTLPQFIAHVQANPGKLQYGSAGVGSVSQLACVLVNQMAGLDVTHIPYRGVAPAMQVLLGGRIAFMCNPLSVALGQSEAGLVKAIAILSPHRDATAPNIATAAEQGLKDFDADSWAGLFLPKGAPAA